MKMVVFQSATPRPRRDRRKEGISGGRRQPTYHSPHQANKNKGQKGSRGIDDPLRKHSGPPPQETRARKQGGGGGRQPCTSWRSTYSLYNLTPQKNKWKFRQSMPINLLIQKPGAVYAMKNQCLNQREELAARIGDSQCGPRCGTMLNKVLDNKTKRRGDTCK